MTGRVLIISASIGHGHRQAALALQERIQHQQELAVKTVDFLADGSWDLNSLMKYSYYKMLKSVPELYQGLYRLSASSTGSRLKTVMNLANQKHMARLVRRYQPDIVICTHPFPLGAAAALRQRRQLSFSLAGVVTDFTVHPWWAYAGVDRYFVAHAAMVQPFVRQGVPGGSIVPTGIPIGSRFAPAMFKAAGQPHILVMGGGLGLGSMDAIFPQLAFLAGKVKVTVLTGDNRALQQRLLAVGCTLSHDIAVLPFTNQVAELMRQADVLITKPGGLTCSEALASELPMLLCQPLPGQEEDNAAFLSKQGAALWLQQPEQLGPQLNHLLFGSGEPLRYMRQQCRQLSPRQAAATITDTMCRMARGREAVS